MKLNAGIVLLLLLSWLGGHPSGAQTPAVTPRATAAPVAAPAAASAQPGAPKPRPLLILAPYTGQKLVVRGLVATYQGTILQVQLENGQRAAWDKTAFVANLPWYPEAELATAPLDLAALVKTYDSYAREHPEYGLSLTVEANKVRAAQTARTAKAEAVLGNLYDRSAPYTADELRPRVAAAEEAARLNPERRAEIEAFIAPFREHLANLDAGRVLADGQWRTPAELRQQQEQAELLARTRAFGAQLELPLEVRLLGADQVSRVTLTVGIVIGALVLLGFFLMFRRRFVPGLALVALPLGGAAGYAGMLLAAVPGWPEPPATADADARAAAVTQLFFAAASRQGGDGKPPADAHAALGGPGASSVHVSEPDLNAFVSQVTRLQGTPADGAVNLRNVAVRLRPGGVTFCETAEWRGRTLRVRHDFELDRNEGQPTVVGESVQIGQATVPGPVAGWIGADLRQALATFLQAHDPLTTYAVTTFADRALELGPAKADAKPPTYVKSTPPPRSLAPIPRPAAPETPAETPPPPAVAMATPAAPAVPAVPAVPAEGEGAGTPPVEQELPPISAIGAKPGPDTTFYVYAIWDGINSADAGEIATQMDRLREQFGKGNRFHKVGFAFILSGNEEKLRTICNLARQKDLAIGVILGTQTHTGAGKNEVAEDFRAVQWRLDGKEWRGGEGKRDKMVPTPSRYCRLVRDALEKGQRAKCDLLRRVMGANPGVITCINGTIEEELADGGQEDDNKLADYSPFAVTEFRDWLRHTGEYDADKGKYAGQGAPESITGPFVNVKGKPRSPFYGAATPDATVSGGSFNGRFATNFKTWTLKYWDLDVFKERIIDESFNPTPAAGKGFTEGGFDAPRTRGVARWWQTWSWDYHDAGKRYPAGDPAQGAWGFRQVMVRNFVTDMFQVGVKAGLPPNLMFAHQIPGETAGAPRNRSAATPTWTGFLPFNGTVGATRFGFFDPELALRYTKTNPQSRGWGLFEWHPIPTCDPKDQKLYTTASEHLRTYYKAKCHHLFAGWWKSTPPANPREFPLADSEFAHAIKDFMASCPDQPYPGTPR